MDPGIQTAGGLDLLKRIWVGFALATFAMGHSASVNATCPEPPASDLGSRKGLTKRIFSKSLRHEINLGGGVFSNEITGSAFSGSASYSFHLNEDFGVEAGLVYTRFRSLFSQAVENLTGYSVYRVHDARLWYGNLVWHPIHGKFLLFNTVIPHFDIYLSAGLGVTDSNTASGLTSNFGVGMKIFTHSWLSIRLDVRNFLFEQEIVNTSKMTNNLSMTLGVGFWLPAGK
jgi:outer membrane beta-barrel protein